MSIIDMMTIIDIMSYHHVTATMISLPLQLAETPPSWLSNVRLFEVAVHDPLAVQEGDPLQRLSLGITQAGTNLEFKPCRTKSPEREACKGYYPSERAKTSQSC